jgi:hypothetical protein
MEKLSIGNETNIGEGRETSENTDEKNMYIDSVRESNV